MSRELRVLHQIHLAGGAWGGMEKQFVQWLEATHADPRLRHFLSEDLRAPAARVAATLPKLAAPPQDPRRWRGITVPNWAGLRQKLQAQRARRWNIDAVLSWNRFGDPRPLQLARRLGAAAIYWERGAAWFARSQPPGREFTQGFDAYFANSKASEALLRHWGVTAPVLRCPPAVLRTTSGRAPRQLRKAAPLQIGFSARLQPFKGGVLAVHALHELRRRGVDAELQVAGDGPDLAAMRAQTQRLGLEGQVHFLGMLGDMDAYLDRIDLLLHPALREPFGNSCAEALAAGIPVVATAVDGIPEIVEDGVTGVCVPPTLAQDRFAAFGGDANALYPLVYRPEIDKVAAPGLPEPSALAQACLQITDSAQTYTAYSSAALAAAERQFRFPDHVDRVLAALQQTVRHHRAS